MATPVTSFDPQREDLRILAVRTGLTFATIAVGIVADRMLKYAAKRAQRAIDELRRPEPSRDELEALLREQLPEGFVVDRTKPFEWEKSTLQGQSIFLARPTVRYIGPPGQAPQGV